MSNSFKVEFNDIEINIFNKYKLSITNNERNYTYRFDNKAVIYDFGTPCSFECLDFKWSGSSWKDLMIEFITWYIKNEFIDNEKLINLQLSFSKQFIFSKDKKTNHHGPFSNGIYVNGNLSGNHMWWQIVDLIEYLGKEYQNTTILKVHYPSAIEPKEIINIIWKKEIILFRNYLFDLGYNSEKVLSYIDITKQLNSMYKRISENYLFFIIDRRPDLLNAVSRLRKTLDNNLRYIEYLSLIDNFMEFKKEIYYEDATYCHQ